MISSNKEIVEFINNYKNSVSKMLESIINEGYNNKFNIIIEVNGISIELDNHSENYELLLNLLYNNTNEEINYNLL